jgi:hypothetical protein
MGELSKINSPTFFWAIFRLFGYFSATLRAKGIFWENCAWPVPSLCHHLRVRNADREMMAFGRYRMDGGNAGG